MIGKLETALEGALGDTAIEIFAGFSRLFALFTLDLKDVGVSLDAQFLFIETGNGHGDAVGVFTRTLDVVGRIGLSLIRLAKAVEHGEKAVETDGGTVKGREVYVTHGVLL